MSRPRRWAIPLDYHELMTLGLADIQRLAEAGPRRVDALPAEEFAPRPALVDLWRRTVGPKTNGDHGLVVTYTKIAEPFDERVEEGGGRRHMALLSFAGTLRRRGLETDEIVEHLTLFSERRLDPPAPEADIRRIAESVAGYEPNGVPFDDQLWQKMQLSPPDRALDAVGAVQVWTRDEPPPRRFAVPGLIPAGATSLFYGDGGTGKSYLLNLLCQAKARGTAFAGVLVEQEVVLYVDGELDLEEFTRRAYAIARGAGYDRPPEGLHYLQLPGPLSNPAVMEAVTAEVRRIGATFVGLDSLTIATYGTDPSAAQDMTAVMKQIERWGTVVALDHIPKPAPGANLSHYRAFGTVFKGNLARSVVQVLQSEGGALTLRHAKANFGALVAPIHLAMEFTTKAVAFSVLRPDDERLAGLEDHMPAVEKVYRALLDRGEPVAPEALAEQLGLIAKTVKNYLTTLRHKGRAERVGEGKWRAARPAQESQNPNPYRDRDFGTFEEEAADPLLEQARAAGWPVIALPDGSHPGGDEGYWRLFLKRAGTILRNDAFEALAALSDHDDQQEEDR